MSLKERCGKQIGKGYWGLVYQDIKHKNRVIKRTAVSAMLNYERLIKEEQRPYLIKVYKIEQDSLLLYVNLEKIDTMYDDLKYDD